MTWKDDRVSASEMSGLGRKGWSVGFGWVSFVCLAKESVVETFESNADFCICLSYFGCISVCCPVFVL